MAYFRIKEAADKVGVPPHVLRFWESQFPLLKPEKSSRGQRQYNDADLQNFLKIKHLLYTEGYSIPGAKKVLKEQRQETRQAPSKADQAVNVEILRELSKDLRSLRDYVKSF